MMKKSGRFILLLRLGKGAFCATLLASLAMYGEQRATMATVLQDISSGGPPADPLPPLRSNRPSAREMASRVRPHPYLFFDSDSRSDLIKRSSVEPFKTLMARLREHADLYLKTPIPKLAKIVEGIPQYRSDGSYNPEFLRNNYDEAYFQSYTVRDVIPTLAFAYQMTGDIEYGAAAKKWLLNFAARPELVRKDRAADFDAGNMLFGMALGYDWLAELLSVSERRQVREALKRNAGPIIAAAKRELNEARPDLHRGFLGNNHTTRTNGLFGLVPLALLYEEPAACDWLDLEIQLHRDRLLPSAWAPDGEYLDAWDHFEAALEDTTPFLEALQRMGGENLFADPLLVDRFRGIPRYWLYGLEYRFQGRSRLYSWLALAAYLRDPVAQWLVMRDPRLSTVNEIFGYLFYDSTVPAEAPAEPTGSVYWPYSGMVKLCTGWTDPHGILMPFRCGPEIGKDLGDQNGFRLRVRGEWLVPRLTDVQKLDAQPAEFSWDLWAWFRGSPAQNVVIVDPDDISDFDSYSKSGRIRLDGGIQYAQYPPMSGRELEKQWLSGATVPKRGEIKNVSFSGAVDYVCGEAHRAYSSLRPHLWVRHVLFARPSKQIGTPYFVICDELQSDSLPRTFAWQLHSKAPIAVLGDEVRILGQHAQLEAKFLLPVGGVTESKSTPAPRVEERSNFIQRESAKPEKDCVFLVVIVPQGRVEQVALPGISLVEAAGGWALEVKSEHCVDLILFRAAGAEVVSARGIETKQLAALERVTDAGSRELLLFGR